MKIKPTLKQIIEVKNGEISMCPNCYSMTKLVLIKKELRCEKCRRLK